MRAKGIHVRVKYLIGGNNKMKSLTKNKQNSDEIIKMAEKAFGKKNIVKEFTELKEGYFNAAYSLRLYDGNEVVLKIAPKETANILSYEKNIMRVEVEALQLIKTHTTVPVPVVYLYDDSKKLCDSEYFFMEKMKGTNYRNLMNSLNSEQKKMIETEIGSYNWEINQIKGNAFGYFIQPQKQSAEWGEAFYILISDILNDGAALDIELPFPYVVIHDIVRKYLFACDSVKEPKLIHWDLWPGNVIINEGKISGIIDLERALWADPLMEYYFGNLSDSKYFCMGYKENLICDDEAKIRRMLYNLYLYLVMKIESKYRGYKDLQQSEWAGKMIAAEIENLNKM